MRVRVADLKDIPELTRLNLLVQELHVEAEPRYFKMPLVAEVQTYFHGELSKAETRALVAEEEGVAVGYLLGAVSEREENIFFRSRSWMQIDHVSVDPDYQRQGHGRALVDTAIEYAQAAGVRDLQVGIWAFNQPSIALFEGAGFRSSELRLRMQIG